MAAKGGDKHTVFRIGEMSGNVTDRVNELIAMFSMIDSTKATTNLLGERWSKLIQNSMRNGVAAVTGLTSGECDTSESPRRFAIKLGGEGVQVADKLGVKLVGLGGMQPEQLAKASAGDVAAMAEVEKIMIARNASNPRAGIQRPSMAQDMKKGRRTEIEFMNGYIAAKGREVGIPDAEQPEARGPRLARAARRVKAVRAYSRLGSASAGLRARPSGGASRADSHGNR
jgi:2-dehydropantoate 2-reductase